MTNSKHWVCFMNVFTVQIPEVRFSWQYLILQVKSECTFLGKSEAIVKDLED